MRQVENKLEVSSYLAYREPITPISHRLEYSPLQKFRLIKRKQRSIDPVYEEDLFKQNEQVSFHKRTIEA
ncbi:hypothetical protein RRG08_005339 [Elysia crispata]|uniref:Uncharacterized protein n=1 Tax=Elysia crispata TaxID=231223 RepID=A0AAE1CPD2_9GAST|nr:hypothetical protein RRG08_005339 [Elysia crispata]